MARLGWVVFTVAGLFSMGVRADWMYRVVPDQMTGKETKLATLESNNSLSLEFPYGGRNYGSIAVRQHPRMGRDVMVQVEKGQILCRLSASCKVLVRFDDAEPVEFRGSPSSDHDSRVVFLQNSEAFLRGARSAKSILVQFGMYQAGNQVLRFHSSMPLEWGAPAAASPAKSDASVDRLLGKYLCSACHIEEGKLVGPSYASIRERYAGRADAEPVLIASLLGGSEGKWGTTPMPASPGLTFAEARRLARWLGAK